MPSSRSSRSFHLLNGDLCYANLNPLGSPKFGAISATITSALPQTGPGCPVRATTRSSSTTGRKGLRPTSLAICCPSNGSGAFYGHWYTFRVGNAVLFVSLDADDVIYQDGAAFVAGPSALVPASATGNPPIQPGTSFYVRGYSGGLQTAWLQRVLVDGSQRPKGSTG